MVKPWYNSSMVGKLLSLKSVGVFRNVVGAAKQVVEIVRAV